MNMTAENENENKVSVQTSWCVDDVRNFYGAAVEHMTDEQILGELLSLSRRFEDKCIESGWEVIEFLFETTKGGDA